MDSEQKTEIVARIVARIRKNRIWDDGKYLILEHVPTGQKAYFDRSKKVFKRICKAIKKYGTIGYKAEKDQFCLDSTKGHRMYLPQLLYSIYTGRPMAWVRKGFVHYLDGNSHNLTSANLVHTHEDTADNLNRRIDQIGKYIFLTHKKSGTTVFCNNDPELYKLLCKGRLVWELLDDNGKLRASIIRGNEKISDCRPLFHQLVYAVKNYGARNNNYISAFRRMQADFKKKGLTIDHLDNCQLNGMDWNLSEMTRSENSTKKDMVGRIRYPFFLFAVYFEGKYRLYYGRVYETPLPFTPQIDYHITICETPADLIDFLDSFLSAKWEDGLSPARNLKDHPDAVCFQNYFGDFGAEAIREELMTKPEDEFTVWERREKVK